MIFYIIFGLRFDSVLDELMLIYLFNLMWWLGERMVRGEDLMVRGEDVMVRGEDMFVLDFRYMICDIDSDVYF